MSDYERDLEIRCEKLLDEVETLTKMNEVLSLSVKITADTMRHIDALIDSKLMDIEKKWIDESLITGEIHFRNLSKDKQIKYKADHIFKEYLKKFKLDVHTVYNINNEILNLERKDIMGS